MVIPFLSIIITCNVCQEPYCDINNPAIIANIQSGVDDLSVSR